MRHDPALARIVSTRLAHRWPRLARLAGRYERRLVLSGIGVAIAAFGLIPARAIVAWCWP
jgi:hypothetical protein